MKPKASKWVSKAAAGDTGSISVVVAAAFCNLSKQQLHTNVCTYVCMYVAGRLATLVGVISVSRPSCGKTRFCFSLLPIR